MPGLPPVLVIARLTVQEASRRRLLLALVILTLIVVGISAWGFYKITTVTGPNGRPPTHEEVIVVSSQLLIFVTVVYSGVLALSPAVVPGALLSTVVLGGLVLSRLARRHQRDGARRHSGPAARRRRVRAREPVCGARSSAARVPVVGRRLVFADPVSEHLELQDKRDLARHNLQWPAEGFRRCDMASDRERNIEMARKGYQAFNEQHLDEAMETIDDDILWHSGG